MNYCRNGHRVNEARRGKCPECARLSRQRRNRRYYLKNRERLLQTQAERRVHWA